MKKIIDAIRDFLYNITDYGLIITVVVVMVLVLGWRFNILFSRSIDKEVIKETPEMIEQSNTNNPEPSDPEKPDAPEQTDKPDNPSGNEPENGLIATINIPEGSYPSKIADILINSNLIEDKDTFLNRSIELGLDTRLRSGTYEIKVGTSLDDIIKTLANAK